MQEVQDVLWRVLQKKTEEGEVLAVRGEQVVVSRQPCPAVLLSANKNLPQILLVEKFTQHKRVCSSSSTSTTCSTPVSVRNGHTNGLHVGATDLDVTGSPLKCPFNQYDEDLSPFVIALDLADGKRKGNASLTYAPLPSAKARCIASEFNLALSKLPKDTEFVPLWVVCDGKDAQGTLFFSFHREQDTHHRTLVTSGGPYHGLAAVPSLDHLIMHHKAFGPTKRVDTAVEATYSVFPSEDEVRSSSVSLTCNWKRPLTVLSSPAPDASTIINVHVDCRDPRSAAHQMYLELSVLRGFVNGMETGEVSWFLRQTPKTMAEELEEMFAGMKEKGVLQAKREDEGGFDFDMMIEGGFLDWHQNMDVTDCLWSLLMKCESYQELKDSLSLVFKAVAGEEIRPQIHARNTTQVGRLLHNLMRGRGEVPELTGLMPLQMLVEMGCEKIKKDYINIFQAGELVTGEQLAWFVRARETGTGIADMSQAVAQLERLHVTLQVVVALRTYLHLSLTSLIHFTAQVLNQMKEEEPTSSHSFSMKLDTLSVLNQFKSMKEDAWKVSLHSQEGSYSKLLMCHFSHSPLIQLPANESEFDEVEDEVKEKEDDEDEYFCTFFSSVTDKLLQQ